MNDEKTSSRSFSPVHADMTESGLVADFGSAHSLGGIPAGPDDARDWREQLRAASNCSGPRSRMPPSASVTSASTAAG